MEIQKKEFTTASRMPHNSSTVRNFISDCQRLLKHSSYSRTGNKTGQIASSAAEVSENGKYNSPSYFSIEFCFYNRVNEDKS